MAKYFFPWKSKLEWESQCALACCCVVGIVARNLVPSLIQGNQTHDFTSFGAAKRRAYRDIAAIIAEISESRVSNARDYKNSVDRFFAEVTFIVTKYLSPLVGDDVAYFVRRVKIESNTDWLDESYPLEKSSNLGSDMQSILFSRPNLGGRVLVQAPQEFLESLRADGIDVSMYADERKVVTAYAALEWLIQQDYVDRNLYNAVDNIIKSRYRGGRLNEIGFVQNIVVQGIVIDDVDLQDPFANDDANINQAFNAMEDILMMIGPLRLQHSPFVDELDSEISSQVGRYDADDEENEPRSSQSSNGTYVSDWSSNN